MVHGLSCFEDSRSPGGFKELLRLHTVELWPKRLLTGVAFSDCVQPKHRKTTRCIFQNAATNWLHITEHNLVTYTRAQQTKIGKSQCVSCTQCKRTCIHPGRWIDYLIRFHRIFRIGFRMCSSIVILGLSSYFLLFYLQKPPKTLPK